MSDKLFEAALGVSSPWYVAGTDFDAAAKTLTIRVNFTAALKHLGIEHIAAYSPEARGRSERAFGTLQDRLIKELAKAGMVEIEAANAWIGGVYLPDHNARFARPAALPEVAFVPVADTAALREILCRQEDRVVGRDNTLTWAGRKLQLPESPLRHHWVKAHVGCTTIRTARWRCSTARAVSPVTTQRGKSATPRPDAP